MTEIISFTGQTARLVEAARLLEGGGLVVFPTETVYGIGCIAADNSINRLDALKERAAEKRYTLHISGKHRLGGYVPKMTIQAKKIIEKYWPGPVTIVFELDEKSLQKQEELVGDEAFGILYRNGTIGIRCPDNALAADFLDLVTMPVVAPSANTAGQQPATTAQQAFSELNGKVDMILDGGPKACKYKKNSTVVKAARAGITVLREGVYTTQDIRDMSTVRILFVCMGNTCRSPMAEGFCRKYLSEKLKCNIDELENAGYIVASAGLAAMKAMPASPQAVDVGGRMGIDLSLHASRRLCHEDITSADYIFAMSRSQRDAIIEINKAAENKCFLLTGSSDIEDPIGTGYDNYSRCADRIAGAVLKRISEILI